MHKVARPIQSPVRVGSTNSHGRGPIPKVDVLWKTQSRASRKTGEKRAISEVDQRAEIETSDSRIRSTSGSRPQGDEAIEPNTQVDDSGRIKSDG